MLKRMLMTMVLVLLVSFTFAHGALVVHYKFDDGSGTTAMDSAGGDNPGSFSTAPGWSSWPANKAPISGNGGAVQFSSPGDTLTTPDASNLDNLSAFTIMMWVKGVPLGNYAYPRLAEKGSAYMVNWYTRTDDVRIEVSVGGTSKTSSFVSRGNLDGWHHWAVTYDSTGGSNNVVFYLDADPISHATLDGGSTPNNDNVLSIANNTSGSRSMDEIMDDFRLYNDALSESQIESVAEIPEPVTIWCMVLGFGLWRRRRA